MHMPTIRPATSADDDTIWSMLEPVIRGGETYALPRDMSREAALTLWRGADRATFVVGEIATYYLRPNAAGPGAHVANCGYVTAGAARGRGIASEMCAHSLAEARQRGFRAMQFNLVAATNLSAVRLWQRHGFEIVGTLPGAFEHPAFGDVDAHVMYRRL